MSAGLTLSLALGIGGINEATEAEVSRDEPAIVTYLVDDVADYLLDDGDDYLYADAEPITGQSYFVDTNGAFVIDDELDYLYGSLEAIE